MVARPVHFILLAVLVLLCGCANRKSAAIGERVTIFVPGVAGDGVGYDGLYRALSDDHGAVEVMTWGAPKALFFNNFSDKTTHDTAEQKLTDRINALPVSVRRIDLIAHSAGCGVVVGGLARTDRSVDTVVLIAPSFSPTYDLSPALWRMRGRLHLFSSTGDTTFLKWRTGNFGTYDRIKTPAAGYAGADLSDLDPTLRARVVQHAWQSEWKSLGNDGGHFGGVSGAFVRQVVLPLFGDRDDAR